MDDAQDRFRFSTVTADVDRDRVHSWLSEESYWAKGRSRGAQDAAIDSSRNYSLFDNLDGTQVAYARVVTDGTTFAWLCDVFVDAGHRGVGLGKRLVAEVLADLDPEIRRVMLATQSAHGLYEPYGFTALADPSIWMVRGAGAKV